jgi:hypothetical protein
MIFARVLRMKTENTSSSRRRHPAAKSLPSLFALGGKIDY